MLQVQVLKDNKAEVIRKLAVKYFDAEEIIEKIIALDENRKSTQNLLDNQLAEANKLAKEIGMLFKSGKGAEANELKQKTAELKQSSKVKAEELENISKELNELLVELPNIPHDSVPAGKTEDDNETIYEEGEFPQLHDKAQSHWDLAKEKDIIDFDLGSKVTGAGFPFYKGKGARYQRALINFFLDEAQKAGYTEYQPPLFVNKDSAYGTGQLPDKDGQMYYINADDFYMIPTAEVPITNIYRNVILNESDFPIKNAAYSSCFRREAGSYGKDVRGLNRLHQFDKVEIVHIEHPEKSYETLETMKDYVADLLRKLELPFRVLRLCGGDLSFASALTFDFEVYSAAQKRWLEVSSVSNFENFQSNRMKLRFKDKDGKMQLAHTLNGSALALPRILAALLENHQTEEGIKIPKALQEYTGFELI
ncbi:MAG: serine--tRNA ligase [Bacteroidetes bacterium]|nr:serine--tRNA ligase [Bacteroidota bacterium]